MGVNSFNNSILSSPEIFFNQHDILSRMRIFVNNIFQPIYLKLYTHEFLKFIRLITLYPAFEVMNTNPICIVTEFVFKLIFRRSIKRKVQRVGKMSTVLVR